jgi:hypothetical protein
MKIFKVSYDYRKIIGRSQYGAPRKHINYLPMTVSGLPYIGDTVSHIPHFTRSILRIFTYSPAVSR